MTFSEQQKILIEKIDQLKDVISVYEGNRTSVWALNRLF